MSTVTKDPHAWFVVTNSKGEKQTLTNDDNHAYSFAFEVNFANASTPQTNTVTIYNMTKKHRNFYQKGQKCWLYFNWGTAKKLICEGYISRIGVSQSDGVTDSLVITFTEGTDYSNVLARKLKVTKTKQVNSYKTIKTRVPGHWVKRRVVVNHHYKYKKVWVKATVKKKRVKTRKTKSYQTNIAFHKGKKYSYIIRAIASQAGIKISKMQLAKDETMKRAYTAKGKPLKLITELAKKCGSKMTYVRGKLVIVNPKAKKRTWYEIDDNDLMEPPTKSDDSDNGTTWEITTPLVPDITVNVGIRMKSRYLKGNYYVTSGQHSSDGDSLQTQCSLKKI